MTQAQQDAQSHQPHPASAVHPQVDLGRFEVYDVALQFQAVVSRLLPTAGAVLRDQLDRASVSILANTAEGFGRRPRRDKARLFGYARGSAYECCALLDVLCLRGQVPATEYQRGKGLLVRCIQMLTRVQTRLLSV